MFEGGLAKSQKLGAYYQRVAEQHLCAFLDAGQVIVSSDLDGVHFEADQHSRLGKAVAGEGEGDLHRLVEGSKDQP